MTYYTIIVKEPRGECQFCESSRIHDSGYGYICINPDGKLRGEHITTEHRGVDSGCEVWKLFNKGDNKQ